ncbi:unnamed protein product, partial [Amoebophrya sp. A25]
KKSIDEKTKSKYCYEQLFDFESKLLGESHWRWGKDELSFRGNRSTTSTTHSNRSMKF